ncbi:MAG: hypothetical protein ACTHWO_00820 [Nesterenkonia sp.]
MADDEGAWFTVFGCDAGCWVVAGAGAAGAFVVGAGAAGAAGLSATLSGDGALVEAALAGDCVLVGEAVLVVLAAVGTAVLVGVAEALGLGVVADAGSALVVTSMAGPRSWSAPGSMLLATAVPPMAAMLSAPVMAQVVWRLMMRSCSLVRLC